MSPEWQKTPLFDLHQSLNGRMVDFAGWGMPLHYGSQVKEHHAVRREAGLFDVSHMTLTEIAGPGAEGYLRHLLANDAARLAPGQAHYTLMLNEKGGIGDDLVLYRLSRDHFRTITNASTRAKVLCWMTSQAQGREVVVRHRPDLAIVAAQGPRTVERLGRVLPGVWMERIAALRPFGVFAEEQFMIARTGYTGEDGFEIALPGDQACGLWEKLVAAGFSPAGLGARDTLRLEAGLNLYGTDMDESVYPDECGLSWTVALGEREFVGKAGLVGRKPERKRVGVVLREGGILRNHMLLEGAGEVTSGGFSPTLGHSIGLARVTAGEAWTVEIRGKKHLVQKAVLPFVQKAR